MKTASDRLEKIRKAIEALEEREPQKAKEAGKKEAAPVESKTQYNFTDPESRIMPVGANRGSFVHAHNCQAMVDEKVQMIVAAEAVQAPQDQRKLVPMTEMTIENLGTWPKEVLADAGYFSEAQIRAVEAKGTSVYCPPDPGRVSESSPCPRGRPPRGERFTQFMRRKLRSRRGWGSIGGGR